MNDKTAEELSWWIDNEQFIVDRAADGLFVEHAAHRDDQFPAAPIERRKRQCLHHADIEARVETRRHRIATRTSVSVVDAATRADAGRRLGNVGLNGSGDIVKTLKPGAKDTDRPR